ncbi:MAG: bifunctional diguanylate cyclase/phosphodiesterase [Treponema sp.]|nr:bifunctional diguanylate cyclase/phosphodiesterase [Treponema sp.]
MSLDLKLIINNIAVPILVGEPILNPTGEIVDFNILFLNTGFKKVAGKFFQENAKWSDFKDKLLTDVTWSELALKSIRNEKDNTHTYFSPLTNLWYRIEMNYSNGYIIVTLINITSEKQFRKRIYDSSIRDSLTGLLNRVSFKETFDSVLDIAKYEETMVAILVIDIDNMKNINDSMGQKEGDLVLIKASKILKQFERETIKVFRSGDDEFFVLLTKITNQDSVITITDTIFEAFQMEQLSVSGGIAIYPEHSEEQEELVRFADMGVHYAKKNGKNNFVFFKPDMQRVFIQQLSMHTKITNAVLTSNFKLFYQPQFDITSETLRGFEALIRWTDNELGEVPPSIFIPIAEETGLIIPISNWVLNTAFETLKKWQDNYDFKGILSINISPCQLKQDTFIESISSLLKKYDVNPEYLEFEVTEGVMINNIESTIEKLKMIKDMKIKISLDDFGTGYSSLSYLQTLPLNTLKIDKSFINNITSQDGIQAHITSSIINMVKRLGLSTIAEGVEYPEQMNLLKKINCNIVQGFLKGKPMPEDLCDSYLKGNDKALLTNGNDIK